MFRLIVGSSLVIIVGLELCNNAILKHIMKHQENQPMPATRADLDAETTTQTTIMHLTQKAIFPILEK